MSVDQTTISPREAETVLAQWRLKPLFTRPAGGTANASLTVVTPRGQYVLRRRNPRYSSLGQLSYDHAVIHALARQGLPVPRVVRTASGSRWLDDDGRIYELFDYIDGAPHDPASDEEIAAAGEMLARLHLATEGLTPPGDKSWPRYFDPKASIKALKEAKRSVFAPRRPDLGPYAPTQVSWALDHLLAAAQQCEASLPDRAYWALPLTIIHGDWHPANLKFADHRVVGIFDFDWVGRQPRMVDVTDGLLFFGSVREEEVDGGDIWSLTQPYQPVWERMKIFYDAYTRLVPLQPAELTALPDLMRQRALYLRIDPMVRKVPVARRLAFLYAGKVHHPLAWITEHEEALRQGF